MRSKFFIVLLGLLAFAATGRGQSPTYGPPSGPQVFSGPVTAPDAVLGGPRVDVRSKGAKGDGVTDNCNALIAAANAAFSAGAVLYFPPSTGYFGSSCTIPFLGNWIVDGSGPMALAGGTAASTALISTGTSQTAQNIGIYGPGTINGNFLSPTIIWVMQAEMVNISTNIIGMAVNGKGVYAGDDAGVGAGGYGLYVYTSNFGLHANATHTNSTCIYISAGNGTQGGFTDDSIHDNVLHGCTVGWADHVGGNNRFTNDHAWDQNMTTCFDEFGNKATLTDEYCDTPTTYGYHIRGTGTTIIGGTAYNGTTGNLDNVATAIQFDIPAEPGAYVSGIRIYGNDATHRWAADTNLGFSTTITTWCDIRDESNVVTKQEGSACVKSGSQVQEGNIQLKNGGMFNGAAATYSCTTVCNFAFGSNFQKATLTQNATSTFTLSAPAFTNFTILICQPATGGPFTFAPPANSIGFGTIGTTAGLCSVQSFVWDGTTLRASSPMMTNE